MVKDPSVVIVRGKTIPARWPFFLSLRPRRRSTYMMRTIFARIHCFFRRMFHFGLFLPNVYFGGINAESFHLRSTTLKHTHKRYRRPKVRVAARTILRRKFDFSMWPPSGVQTVLRSSKPRVTFVSPPSTCLNATPNFALEGSKSTCVGDQRLPVRSTQPRVT